MDLTLNGRVAIVTGGGTGIGATIARTLAAAGARVAVNDLNPDRAERVADQIRSSGGTAVAIAADVSNKFQCVHIIETTRAEWGQLDILVNNAAIKPKSTILKMDEWVWNRAIEVNLKGPFFMTQLCGRVMNDAGGGTIINIGSTAGIDEGFANHAAYAASKAGLVGFARECAREFADYGIQVHTLLPAEPVDTSAPAVADAQAVADALAATIAHTTLSLCATGQESSIVHLDAAAH